MNKKKIIHIIPTFELGGVQTGILYSIEELNIKYDYKIFVIGKIDRNWVKNLSVEMQTKIIGSDSSNIIFGFFKGFMMIKKEKPAVLISSLWKSVPLSVLYKILNKKTLLCGFYHNTVSPHFLSTFFFKILALFLDITFADSEATRDFVTRFLKLKNIRIIPYCFFKFKDNIKSPDFSIVKIAYFGRLHQKKGLNRAIDFCKICKENKLNFIFDIYGEGEKIKYGEKIKKFGLEPEVKIKGILPLNKVMETMQHYDFLLHLSYREGMALSVVEAMNCGLIPIVNPVGEIAKYSKDGFNAIWLNEKEDNPIDKLVIKLQSVLNDPLLLRQLSKNASETFSNYEMYSDCLTASLEGCFNKKSEIIYEENFN